MASPLKGKGLNSNKALLLSGFASCCIVILCMSAMIPIAYASSASTGAIFASPMCRGPANCSGISPFSTENNEGTLLWTHHDYGLGFLNISVSNVPIIGRDGTIYYSFRLVSYNIYDTLNRSGGLLFVALAKNGTKLWEKHGLGSWADAPCYAIGNDGTIFVGGVDAFNRNITCALRPDGEEIWRRSLAGEPRSPYIIDQNDNVFFIMVERNETTRTSILQQVKPDGGLGWNLTLNSDLLQPAEYTTYDYLYPDSLALAADGSIYALVSNQWGVSTLSKVASNGDRNWSASYFKNETIWYPIPNGASICLGENDTPYFALGNYYNYLGLASALPNGTIDIVDDSHKISSYYANFLYGLSAGPSGAIYYSMYAWNQTTNHYEGKLCSYSHDGQPGWALNVTMPQYRGDDFYTMMFYSPAISSEGTVYICMEDRVEAVNPNGTIRWTYPFDPMVYHAIRVAIGQDGVLLVFIDASDSLIIMALGPATVEAQAINYLPLIIPPLVIVTVAGLAIYILRPKKAKGRSK